MAVFTDKPLQGDTWDMQGALLYFGNYDVDGQGNFLGTMSSVGQDDSTPSEYNADGHMPIVAVGLNIALQRQVAKRYPINVRRVIYMVGSPDGQMTINCLFGPNQSMTTFLEKFNAIGNVQGDVYATKGTSIFIKPFGQMYSKGQTKGSTLGLGTWVVTDPVITGIGLQISESGTAQVPAMANVSFTFTSLDII